MRRLPFWLALLPGGTVAGRVCVVARVSGGGGWAVRVEGVGANERRISKTDVWSSERLLENTGVDFETVAEVP